MQAFSVARDYLVWHYSAALSDMFHIWWNYLWFVNHLFSVPDVLKTWISPWKRLQEDKVNILMKPEDFFANFFVNLMMRLVGFMVRTALLFIALCSFLIIFIGGIMGFFTWLVLPALVVHFLISGFGFLFA